MKCYPLWFLIVACLYTSCGDRTGASDHAEDAFAAYMDTTFMQEYHQGWKVGTTPDENEIRSVAVDAAFNVWAASKGGVFVKAADRNEWRHVFDEKERGPAFSVMVDNSGTVWMSTWNGVYRMQEGRPQRIAGPESPISVLCHRDGVVFAAGPRGVWSFGNEQWRKVTDSIGRSVRDAVVDTTGSLWVGTDVGLYRIKGQQIDHYFTPDHTISAYINSVDFDASGRLWAAGLGGVSILVDARSHRQLRPADGLPTIYVNSVKRSPDNVMWVGTSLGVVRYMPDFTRSIRFSRRWLMNDHVNDIAFDSRGDAWIATAAGVSAIRRKPMTLASKASYFQDVLMRRHIREPWIAGQCKLPIPGDTTQWLPDDDDNDGEYTGNYLAMESFRYAVSKDPQALENAKKAFRFLKYLRDVTGSKGLFARTIVPSDWKEVDDGNRTYDERQLADELVKEPRFKPVEVRWHLSDDGKWLWKGDTSSDEMCGHMMGYFFYYELAADEQERQLVRDHVTAIVDALMSHDYNLVDVDGTHTRWGVWSPALLNRDAEWMPDRSLNSMELLSFVKLAAYVSGDEKYEQAYLSLINDHGYLDNMSRISAQNPGWYIYYDVMLAAYQYPILLKCEKDPEILSIYQRHMDAWFERYRRDENPLINFLYCYSRDKKVELGASVFFFKDTPLDLIDWPIDHTRREDVRIVRYPVLDDVQVDQLPPASIRGTIRWDKNPYTAVSGNPSVEREPVFWLLPYWMGRYLEMIKSGQ